MQSKNHNNYSHYGQDKTAKSFIIICSFLDERMENQIDNRSHFRCQPCCQNGSEIHQKIYSKTNQSCGNFSEFQRIPFINPFLLNLWIHFRTL